MSVSFERKADGRIWFTSTAYQGTSFTGPLVTYKAPETDTSDPDSDHEHKYSKVHTEVKKHDPRFGYKREWQAFLASERRASPVEEVPVVEAPVVEVEEVPVVEVKEAENES